MLAKKRGLNDSVNMPRTRRRHHSRSRSRSRSHSHDRDREPKRRRVESPDNSHHRRSVSSEKEVSPKEDVQTEITIEDLPKETKIEKQETLKIENLSKEETSDDEDTSVEKIPLPLTPKRITPKKVLSPLQIKKQEEKIKLRQEKEDQRRKEREEREEKKRKEKEEREEQKRKEKEQKRKEKEEKEEQKRKEKEDKEEQKRKDREEKELKKQQEQKEINKEKKKKEELIEKEKAAFANFFRKSTGTVELKKPELKQEKILAFMPFAVKSGMRLASICRANLTTEKKQTLMNKFIGQNETTLYLDEIKTGKEIGLSKSTWPVEEYENDIIIVETDDIGECVEEQPKAKKLRSKLLKFHENRRPAYFGTWRKKSSQITPRNPFVLDKEFFDYEVDSDDDWEEEEPGESLHGSDDEEKENDEKDDYEVDNDFFVPHGYLSDEEIEVEESTLSPETQKEKLKILQEEFDEEMKLKTEKIKPRLIGFIWEHKLIKVQDAIHKFLEDRMMIVKNTIQIQKRNLSVPNLRIPFSKEFIPEFLHLIHGNINNQIFLVNEFQNYLSRKDFEKVSKSSLLTQLKKFAKWKKCPDDGIMYNKHCWYVEEEIRAQYNLNLELPNSWIYAENATELK